MNSHPPERVWFKSSRSEGSKQCVEVFLGDGLVGVRDSKDDGTGPELWFPDDVWTSFLESGIWKA
ncbi:DUF397 domain-containing protein [Nocardia sp. SYP-A9097]|uniref:DUF397 domain-containing protein n=1 Tax=Nocardia sp. SYP-A9097 TaxID=2663237 RepID=UPI00132166C2|nr:DUF397 domain-containing protein [Nocardia sp. SYP-A9097]MRH90126.1 DUF397 domain-containing protein [Nocardia sp. SYP-A9097]